MQHQPEHPSRHQTPGGRPPRKLSLITPSGRLTLGNHLGALRGMVAAQDHATCFFGVSDLHAMTTAHDPAELRERSREVATLMLACGLDPERATLFRQSEVPAHTGLAYLLECTALTGELSRMIQFKEKRRQAGGATGARASLFTYPVLMAADILLYRPEAVPVGDDQRQHVELTRDLALRFNRSYGPVFTVPEIEVPPVAARLRDLADPTRKMSKSAVSDAGVIRLLDDPATVRRKIGRAVTDSDTGPDAVRHDPVAKPGVSNLLELVAACTGSSPEAVAGGAPTYGALKKLATDAVVSVLEPVQRRYGELARDPGAVEEVYAAGARRCVEETGPVLYAARAAIGLG
ncbi:tryptophan--tRNA ligase [Nocardioides mesophilus]|uniref:Tryptophan--tRNA ligase n=1 Tax=Nocardioides mesophilus TaxID=433659 RepID=A0A7G9R6L9_9ACTN|nr:tryptophan--tRNA ligase [Nocardioides mesophilus]QNN51244.1 tryptophan--tRNA ligase [Nocardioides mesophilus]